MSVNVKRDGDKVWIEGVDTYRVCEPLFEAVRVVLTHRGEKCSPAYIQGIAGAAFRIAGICPCAPTCSSAMSPEELARMLGFEVNVISPMAQVNPPGDSDRKFAELLRNDLLPPAAALTDEVHQRLRAAAVAMNVRIKAEVRAGRPVVVWHAFTTAENDVVAGYDDQTGEFLGRGSYVGARGDYGRAKQYRCMRSQLVGGWPTALVIGKRAKDFDARTAELASLRAAVGHARTLPTKKPDGKWTMFQGIACYDRWAEDFHQNPKTAPNGSQYCYGVIRSTHRAADAFLREIAPKYPKAQTALLAAATHFQREADILDGAENLLGWKAPKQLTPEANQQAAAALQKARDEYAAGIAQIEKALTLFTSGGPE